MAKCSGSQFGGIVSGRHGKRSQRGRHEKLKGKYPVQHKYIPIYKKRVLEGNPEGVAQLKYVAAHGNPTTASEARLELEALEALVDQWPGMKEKIQAALKEAKEFKELRESGSIEDE